MRKNNEKKQKTAKACNSNSTKATSDCSNNAKASSCGSRKTNSNK